MTNGRFTRKAAGAVASLALIGGAVAVTAGPAAAADGDVGLQIDAGILSGSIEEVSFGQVTYSAVSQPKAVGAVKLTVNDLRGTNLGWNLNLSSSPLAHGAGGSPISAVNVSTTDVENIVAQQGTATEANVGPLNSPVTTLSAGLSNGDGITTADIDFSVDIPGQAAVGNYTGTLTVDAAPRV